MSLAYLYDCYLASGKVTTDSRNCAPGAIYFALRGDRFNGNDFARSALEAGCSLAVVDDESLKHTQGCYWVQDALAALQQIASHHRAMTAVKIVGITGSNGKTTTKELMAAVLGQKYKVWFTQGNLNNHIGVPLTLLAMPPGTELAVIEMGANHIGEIAALSKISQPDYGLITNVGKAHIEGFGSFEGIKIGKGELYQHLKQKGGDIFINGNNEHLTAMLGSYNGNVFRYGSNPEFEIVCKNASASPMLRFEWKAQDTGWNPVNTNLTGLYNLENALAAICVGYHFGVEKNLIGKALSEYVPENQRSQLTKTETNTVVLDAYNANPSSMTAALENFSQMNGTNKVLILGEMKELGEESMAEHRQMVHLIEKTDVSTCFLVGEEFKPHAPNKPGFFWFESTDELISFIRCNPIRNALVLIKGSRANRLERTMELL
ncbi:UDP-N-acetylmuramoyl-tripeptide--D-alanyl-D-alanine ligase [Alkaliflexus imshenetskii]|uniref:UDP-N-acetylmuramoyl-tripeptide--D-alanyl-D- alanine ligase n=1 Tax=Alkaliflexus imshenetskii TaxID=286730 RepID=UPI00047C921D|nr:UDP-N-acetylmuramoyl-tripeptide--D-alanyl-D-alanine ligase [Alkaliflexus imshenetskii]